MRWEYVKGLRAPVAVLTATPTNGPAPLTVAFSSEGSNDADPGDSIRFEWDFDGDGRSIRSIPIRRSSTRRPASSPPSSRSSTRAARSASANTTITVGNTAPTSTITVPVAGGRSPSVRTSRSRSPSPTLRTASIDCADVQVTFVLGHDTHGMPRTTTSGCSGVLSTEAEDVSHGGNVFGVISASLHDGGGSGGVPAAHDRCPEPDPPEEAGGRGRPQPVRHQHGGQRPTGAPGTTAAASAPATGSS